MGLKQTTRNNYIYMYEHFVMNDFGNRKIKEIRKSDVRRYYNGIVDSKKNVSCNIGEYSYGASSSIYISG